MSWQIDRVGHIEESWRTTNLLQAGVSEALLYNDVDQVLSHSVVLVLEILRQVHCGHLILVDLDRTDLIPVVGVPLKSLINLVQSVDGLA